MENFIYDYAIIGAGLTGLVTTLILKKAEPEKNILLLEKNGFSGGFATPSVLGGIDVDSIYLFPDIRFFLKHLDVDMELYQIKEAFYDIKLIDGNTAFEIKLPPDRRGFISALTGRFPEESDTIIRFVDFCYSIESKFHNLYSKFHFNTLVKFISGSMPLVMNMNLTVSGLIKKFGFKDSRLIRIIETFAGLAQLPPAKLNALIPIIAIVNLTKSSFRPLEAFGKFIANLEKSIADKKIDLKYNSRLMRMKKEHDIFKLTVKNNCEYFSRKVISTIDTKRLFLDIAANGLMPYKFADKIKKLEMTLSAFVIKLIVKSSIPYQTDIGQVLFYGGNDSFRFLYDKAIEGKCTLDEKIFHFALTVKPVKDRNPDGDLYSFELLAVPVSYEYWNDIYESDRPSYGKEIDKWEDFYIGKLERHFDADIRSRLVKKQCITPIFFEKTFSLSQAALYDMAQTASQSGMNRLGFTTPVDGLYHCKMVHGIYGSLYQSFLLADFILSGKLNGYSYKWE